MLALAAVGGLRPTTKRVEFIKHACETLSDHDGKDVRIAAIESDEQPISSGAFGDVHVVNKDFVIKFIVYPEQDEVDRGARVQREFELGVRAGSHNVGPRVHGYLVPASGPVQGAIVMDRMDGDVGRLLDTRRDLALAAIEEQVPSLIATMVDIGMTCTDLKRSNMLYQDIRSGGVRLYFSDFDAEFCSNGEELNVDPALQRIAMATVLSETILRHTPGIGEAPLHTYIYQQMERYASRRQYASMDAEVIARDMGAAAEAAGKMLQHYLRSSDSPVQLVTNKLNAVIEREGSDDEPVAEPMEEPLIPEGVDSESLQFSMSDGWRTIRR